MNILGGKPWHLWRLPYWMQGLSGIFVDLGRTFCILDGYIWTMLQGHIDMHFCKDPIRCKRSQLYVTRFSGIKDNEGILLDLCGSFGIIVDSWFVVQRGPYLFICARFAKDSDKIQQDSQKYSCLAMTFWGSSWIILKTSASWGIWWECMSRYHAAPYVNTQ
jgi:hypothetical protein